MKRSWVGTMLCLLLALPAAAADDEEGFVVGFEATSLRPSGGIQGYVLVDPDDSNGIPDGVVRNLEYDYEASPRVSLGWMDDEGGLLSLSWWNYDEGVSDAVSAFPPSNLWDILFHPDAALGDYEGTALAQATMEATVVELVYSRPLTGNGDFTTRWHAGFRVAELENDLGVAYEDTMFSETRTLVLGNSVEGFGIVGGLSAMYELSDQWMLNVAAMYSFLSGEKDFTAWMDEDGTVIADIASELDLTFSTMEARCSVIWNGPDWAQLWLGLEFGQWNNALGAATFPDDVNQAYLERALSDVTWDGVTFGAAFTF